MDHHWVAVEVLLIKGSAPFLHDCDAPLPPTVGSGHQKPWPPIEEARSFIVEAVEVFGKVRILVDECSAAYGFDSGIGDERPEKAEEIIHFNPLVLDRKLLNASFHSNLELRGGGVQVCPCQCVRGSLEHMMKDAILGPCGALRMRVMRTAGFVTSDTDHVTSGRVEEVTQSQGEAIAGGHAFGVFPNSLDVFGS